MGVRPNFKGLSPVVWNQTVVPRLGQEADRKPSWNIH